MLSVIIAIEPWEEIVITSFVLDGPEQSSVIISNKARKKSCFSSQAFAKFHQANFSFLEADETF